MTKTKLASSSLLMSIMEIILGILLLINPVGFTSGIIVVFGIVLAIMGVGQIIGYFREDAEIAAKSGKLTKGIIFVVFGLFCMFRSEWFIVTFPIITVLYGLLTLVTGVSKLQLAVDMIRTKRRYWVLALISAVLTLVLAVLMLKNPFTSTVFLWNFIGISLIVEAAMDIVTYIFSKKE